LVFKAWTEPEQFAEWWGPRGFSAPLETISLDPTPGGEWRATMVSDADGSEITFNDLGGRTELVLHQAGYLPEDEIGRAQEGWSSFLDCLADHLARP
jgi:Activator of Hsp90 ATPase homolog 1-like protein